jgi:drug/metabolite transporter (DMT)-like permease
MVTTVQMFAGGVALFTAGMIHGDSLDQFFHASAYSWFGWSYLVVIGSVIAYSAYLWLVGNAPVALTSTYAYVNPVIAVILGALVLSEPISLPMVLGASTVILGVILVITAESKVKRAH